MKICAAVIVIVFAFGGCASTPALPSSSADNERSGVRIGPFRADDASNHQSRIQAVLDEHREKPTTFTFARGMYSMTDPRGLRVPAGATLRLGGAKFVWIPDVREDGQTFLVEDAPNVTFIGGAVVGQRNEWDPGVNVAGIRVRGRSNNLSVIDTRFDDLSSNALGVFGESDANPIRNVTLRNVKTRNCCNYYGDYLDEDKGPAKGSLREDQGSVALYYVHGWTVESCAFSYSQSDGTHFFHAHRGRFVNSRVTGSKMGGYFLEGCEDVLAERCYIDANGSRGVTIERDSKRCTLTRCTVANSGREGVWAPDVADITITKNSFRQNGRKDDGDKDCEIRIDETGKYATVTSGIVIEGNGFVTDDHQTAVIYVSNGVRKSIIRGNEFMGNIPRTMMTDTTRLEVRVEH